MIAETDSKDDVHTNKGLLSKSDWTAIAGTNYSSAVVTIPDQIATIWHPTSRIGVYMLEHLSLKVMFGGPAVPINKKPGKRSYFNNIHPSILMYLLFAFFNSISGSELELNKNGGIHGFEWCTSLAGGRKKVQICSFFSCIQIFVAVCWFLEHLRLDGTL